MLGKQICCALCRQNQTVLESLPVAYIYIYIYIYPKLNSARSLNLEGVRSTCGTTEYHPHRFLGLTISDITLRLNVTATVTATLTATVTAMFLLLSLLLLMSLLLLLLLPLLMLLLPYCHSTVTGLTKMCSFPIKSNYPKRYQNAVF